ncbi:hypothetical protein [Blastopirellula marina]|uniref:Uncharacterized protein n=1 Tax=Blastopirellula marina TaxID=124 RepID=A0A2S8FP06_9BACT|nr:hypothetical protein [Blastopirellula marina]PQO33913.1 hypothetical protein C5Y98_16970 [Blastopirellula marina]PTL43700.1 hypothetical protein C5Y97_16980 [Blastopirellula marina]
MVSENPWEETVNPFASPESMVQTYRGKSGEYQIVAMRIHGGKVITLPYFCVRCGTKVAEGDELASRVEKKLSWIHPVTVLLIFIAWPVFILVALLTRKKCRVSYSLCSVCCGKRRRLWFVMGLLALIVIGLFGAVLSFERSWPEISAFLAILGAVAVLGIIAAGLRLTGPLTVAWYSNEVFQLKGATPVFLVRAQPDQQEETYSTAVLAEDGRTA